MEVIISNYGEQDLRDAALSWKVVAGDQTVASETVRVSVPMGTVSPVAHVTLPPAPASGARKLELIVDVDGAHTNSWSFWSYPRGGFLDQPGECPCTPPCDGRASSGAIRSSARSHPRRMRTGLLVTPTLDDGALRHLRAGGRVWLMTERGADAGTGGGQLLPGRWRSARDGHPRSSCPARDSRTRGSATCSSTT